MKTRINLRERNYFLIKINYPNRNAIHAICDHQCAQISQMGHYDFHVFHRNTSEE